LKNKYNKIVNPLNTWIQFKTIERVTTYGDHDIIANEFKQLQLDIRNGDPKDGMHYKWLLKHCNTFDCQSLDEIDYLIKENKLDDTSILVPTNELCLSLNLKILYTKLE